MMSRRRFASALAAGAAAALMPRLARAAERSRGSKHRSRPRAVRGRIMLVRGDRPLAGSRAERDLRAEPADHAGRGGGGDPTRAGPAGRPDRAGGTFLLRHDRDGGRRRSEGLGSRLRRGAGPGCGRGLRGARQDVPDATRRGGHRLRRRRRTTQRGCVPARFRRRSAGGPRKSALCRPTAVSQGAPDRQDHTGRLAFEAELLCGLDGRSNDQSRSSSGSWPSAWERRRSR